MFDADKNGPDRRTLVREHATAPARLRPLNLSFATISDSGTATTGA
jgi:hypothetical protein